MKNQVTSNRKFQERMAGVPDGLFVICPHCNSEVPLSESYICSRCGFYLPIPTEQRILELSDSFEPFMFKDLNIPQKLESSYVTKHEKLQDKTGLADGLRSGIASLDGIRYVIGALDRRFFMASVGVLLGEMITRLFETAMKERLPVLLIIVSGGMRVQEGPLALMQMAKITQVINRHGNMGLPYLSLLTDPTMGGVTASFAMDADVILAEPHARIGFAGKRVAEEAIGKRMPIDFQDAETLRKNGFVDRIVSRGEQKNVVRRLLRMFR